MVFRKSSQTQSLIDWLLFFFVIWFGSHAYLYIFTLGGPKPLYSYLVLIGIAVLFLLMRVAMHRPVVIHADHRQSAIMLWFGIYLVYGCIGFLL